MHYLFLQQWIQFKDSVICSHRITPFLRLIFLFSRILFSALDFFVSSFIPSCLNRTNVSWVNSQSGPTHQIDKFSSLDGSTNLDLGSAGFSCVCTWFLIKSSFSWILAPRLVTKVAQTLGSEASRFITIVESIKAFCDWIFRQIMLKFLRTGLTSWHPRRTAQSSSLVIDCVFWGCDFGFCGEWSRTPPT